VIIFSVLVFYMQNTVKYLHRATANFMCLYM